MCDLNNQINDNTVNMKKTRSPLYQIKRVLKSILSKHHKNTYKKTPQPCYFDEETMDNLSNEILENEIFEDIDSCEAFSAVPVYSNGSTELLRVTRGQRYVPVHFARTDAGTFFWTSMADCDIEEKNVHSQNQRAELQVPCDRWAQA